MPNVNINETYCRLKYGSSESNVHVSDQSKDESELTRLRKSTRKALQESWDEVDSLEQQCAIYTKIIAQHDEELANMQEKEKAWQGRCLIAEAKLQEISEQRDSLQYDMMLDDQDNKAALHEISNKRDALQYPKRLSIYQSVRSWVSRNKDKDHSDAPEFNLKLYSRDEAISSLEQTLGENLKHMQYMGTMMQDLEKSQQIKEKKIYDSNAQKEDHFKELIESLRKELSKSMLRNET